jgi:PhnB protein
MDSTPSVVAYLTVKGGQEAIAFYEKAFGAKVAAKQLADDGKRVLHADLEINGGHIYLSDDFETGADGTVAPTRLGGTTVTIHLESPEAGALWTTAVEAGATEVMPIEKQFWGSLYGRLSDPFGHSWSIGGPAA